MRNILLTIGIVMLFAWAVGFFAFSVGAIIHILLAFAILSFLVGVTPRNKTMKYK